MIELTSQQNKAVEEVKKWFAEKKEPFFYVAGYAGTGKTYLAKYFAADIPKVKFAAFTGKAAKVMRSKGCPDATTLHSLIYKPKQKSRKRVVELTETLKAAKDDAEKLKIEKELKREHVETNKPSFAVNEEDAPLRGSDLLILDECSMISKYLAEDALSFKIPILVLGDPAQLPPVKGAGYFTSRNPNFLLTEVHRQVADSPVLDLATKIRNSTGSIALPYSDQPVSKDFLLSIDQILTGKNQSRRAINQWMRKQLGFKSKFPAIGDKLVCLKNDPEQGLLNGMILKAETNSRELAGDMILTVKEEDSEESIDVVAIREPFEQYANPNFIDHRTFWDRKDLTELDYAYALTVHKAQGSSWEHVLILDDGFGYTPADRKKWLYTAVTRASKKVTVLKFNLGDFK